MCPINNSSAIKDKVLLTIFYSYSIYTEITNIIKIIYNVRRRVTYFLTRSGDYNSGTVSSVCNYEVFVSMCNEWSTNQIVGWCQRKQVTWIRGHRIHGYNALTQYFRLWPYLLIPCYKCAKATPDRV